MHDRYIKKPPVFGFAPPKVLLSITQRFYVFCRPAALVAAARPKICIHVGSVGFLRPGATDFGLRIDVSATHGKELQVGCELKDTNGLV